MLNKELLLHLFLTTPLLTIGQAIYAANLAASAPDQTTDHNWLLISFFYLLLFIPINAILCFVLFGISSWLKKTMRSVLLFNVIGLVGAGALLVLKPTNNNDYLYSSMLLYSSFFVMSGISILFRQSFSKSTS
ncbi:hypothetical protein [Paenibacillus xylaniclasticus]|uniref:hypothetical protein n=1 Tax=Paenibacillus xylaniclasticus TaxID=588083 RepID=UPI000FDC558C|nr:MULTISPECIES: hypothetical protein [Paenibacillus]GFN32223.1 hypothetical protein PCURB6_24830 [Paenibacillus curdlanolyticus]